MDWKIKAFLQKILAAGRFGDKLNHIPITLKEKYHWNVFTYQTNEALRKFGYADLKSCNRFAALEIGTGYSVLSSIVLSLLGFGKVITADITNDISFPAFKKQIVYLDSPDFLKEISSKSIYKEEKILEKISIVKKIKSFESLFKFLNITYIAPYKFDDIDNINPNFDYICSQVVLEHVRPAVLEELFKRTKKWLNKDGYCVHTINFIDHFANPGFFQDKSISEFNFLKYSDKYWAFWAGNPIAFTNRLSYLYYLELSERNNLEVINFIGENYRKQVRLDVTLIHDDILKKYKSLNDKKELVKYQRGTMIIKG